MKRSIFVTLLVLVILSLALSACAKKPAATEPGAYPSGGESQGAAPTAYPVAEKIKVVVATDATFPPFETVDEATKELTGFDIELMKAIAARSGIEIEWVNAGFDAIDSGIATCQYDAVIAAMSITEERKQNRLFSNPYVSAGQILSVRIDETVIKVPADLQNKIVGAQIGTTGAIEAGKIPNATLKTYDSYDLAFLDLMNGQVDAVIADFPTAFDFVGQYSEKLKLTGEVFTDEFYGIAVCKNKPEIVEAINIGLQKAIDDGTLKQLEAKWLNIQQ